MGSFIARESGKAIVCGGLLGATLVPQITSPLQQPGRFPRAADDNTEVQRCDLTCPVSRPGFRTQPSWFQYTQATLRLGQ